MAIRTTARDDARPGQEQLLLLAGRGDVDAFAELYDELAPRVFGLVTCLVRDPGTAETVTREAFIEAWRRAPTYDPTTSSAGAWVIALAHLLATRVRRLSAAASDRRPTACSDRSALLAAGLSDAQADALRLAYLDGLDHVRLAALLDSDEPATSLLRDGLAGLAGAAPPR